MTDKGTGRLSTLPRIACRKGGTDPYRWAEDKFAGNRESFNEPDDF